MKEQCQHERLHFGSGAYYLFCNKCTRKWIAWKPNATEVGGDVDARGDLVTGEFRIKEKKLSKICKFIISLEERFKNKYEKH
jgi:hypothetical protein